jgi:DHA2 family multidrug resistance protein
MNTETSALQPLKSLTLALSATAICAIAFAEVLDMTIVNVAVPSIAGEFGASTSEGTWVITSYAMSAAAVLPLTGWLTKRLGQVRLFVLASVIFTCASVLCGMARSLDSLVAFRILQGVVSGPLVPLSQSLMLVSFPPAQRGMALGIWAATVLTAPIMGPIAGGWLTDNWSWRACFYINVPVGLFSATALWVLLRHRDNPPMRERVDWLGAALLIIGVVTLQLMMDHGNQDAWFESTFIAGLAAASLVSLALFATWERFERFPIMDFSLLRLPVFTVPLITSSLGNGASMASMVVHPLWLQSVCGYTASMAGLAVAGFGAAAMITSLAFGLVIQRVPLRATAVLGLLMFIWGAWLLSRLTMESSFTDHFWARVPQGIGLPLFQMSTTRWWTSHLPEHRFPAAASMMAFLRTLCAALATALAIWLWDFRSAIHHSALAETINSVSLANQPLLSGPRDPASAFQSIAMLDRVAQLKARTLAFVDVNVATAVLFFMLIIMLWLTVSPSVAGSKPVTTH